MPQLAFLQTENNRRLTCSTCLYMPVHGDQAVRVDLEASPQYVRDSIPAVLRPRYLVLCQRRGVPSGKRHVCCLLLLYWQSIGYAFSVFRYHEGIALIHGTLPLFRSVEYELCRSPQMYLYTLESLYGKMFGLDRGRFLDLYLLAYGLAVRSHQHPF